MSANQMSSDEVKWQQQEQLGSNEVTETQTKTSKEYAKLTNRTVLYTSGTSGVVADYPSNSSRGLSTMIS